MDRSTPLKHYTISFVEFYVIYKRVGELKFFKDISFAGFQSTLDGEMKRLQFLGIGAKRHQDKPLPEEEEKLWQLGDHSPQELVDTMLFIMHGIYFALRSGHEHCSLCFEPAHVDLVVYAGEHMYATPKISHRIILEV